MKAPAPGGEDPAVPVVEIFGPTLQGEGQSIGRKTMFVRLAGCDWSCRWCDTPYAWRPGALQPPMRLTPAAILQRLAGLDAHCREVTLTGGNPALHDCTALVAALHRHGYHIHVETQGSRAPQWLAQVDSVTVSPKGPSSGMPPAWEALDATLAVAAHPELKVVVFDEGDYRYAAEVHRRYLHLPLTLQVGHHPGVDDAAALLQRTAWLAQRTLGDPAMQGVRVLPQLHVLLWGDRPGV